MVRKVMYVKRGDLYRTRSVFLLERAQEPAVQESEHP